MTVNRKIECFSGDISSHATTIRWLRVYASGGEPVMLRQTSESFQLIQPSSLGTEHLVPLLLLVIEGFQVQVVFASLVGVRF